MQRTLILVLFLLLAGSAFRVAPRAGARASDDVPASLYVINGSLSNFTVWLRSESGAWHNLGRIWAGEKMCMQLPHFSRGQLFAARLGRQVIVESDVFSNDRRGWEWDVSEGEVLRGTIADGPWPRKPCATKLV